MAISKDKEQIVAVIPEEHKKILERIAEEDDYKICFLLLFFTFV